ncbi:MAG TPA: S-layer homology domain-containing protein [Symbiobacteriaceae bacterium]|nr:S-layer homology domain-containing protein [Symbiobacteriaceae bacterium]
MLMLGYERMVYKRRMAVLVGVMVLALVGASPAFGYLSDMAGHWAAPLVGALEAKEIVLGDESGRFQPEAHLTRAQLAKLLVTSLGYQEEASLLAKHPSRFHDVVRWHWAKGYIEALAETGVIEGFPDGRFGPEETVTRAQLAAILTRAAGQSEQARMLNFERTGYRDDVDVPDWSRGAINVARATGIMEGFQDGMFRPLQPVTRAEGSVALYRLMSREGSFYHLTGTLVRFDPLKLEGAVRDSRGSERAFTMASTAQYFRAGTRAVPAEITVLDQVWIVLDASGSGRFLEARYADFLATKAEVDGQSLVLTGPDGTARQFVLQTGALLYLNGKPVPADQLMGIDSAYAVLDRETGEIRLLDAISVTLEGILVGIDELQGTLYLETPSGVETLPLAPSAVALLNGTAVPVADLLSSDEVELATDEGGTVIYLSAER